ncbi:Oxygen-independent coproporphyrinogen-III oxidase [Sulfitobacter sp. THAF37]|uniref:oxygen-independent coproporphyrinogen III oxidase n=1 Tax=Sulfitobacter sp. THAF37 TaxID=2587855 RepID=UPI001268DF3A|nr:oxygen-independent coproporphyrinogen III oxidase [Sulfitobacter sp. THAF37]QFT57672.1 Oxygen-independent coproporphyrinogen-III oxidase [Sulfitobacter sp. THAF37]
MQSIDSLRRHGLFDARVPRYTSYPPANHFEDGFGPRHQTGWLAAVPRGGAVSVYVHIPFCKRLCWFCACRTQGTATLRPVDAYVAILLKEIETVRQTMPEGVRMGRLHLGGGTPTILSPDTMSRLLDALFAAFEPTADLEFSVEIDPTEASDNLLKLLIARGMNRASVGVQDFAEEVQKAIGRRQPLAQTRHVIDLMRAGGVASLNLDLLYGLPHQTAQSFGQTLRHVADMRPDRLAIYGYAHVPWMSKRQIMIKADTLLDNETRFALAQQAHDAFTARGYDSIGIDHYALPTDSLARAAASGRLRRNFQGYTDDPNETLIGLGASAISRFAGGYLQNATATSAYQDRVNQSGLAAHKGYGMSPQDRLIARIVEDLMCRFVFDEAGLRDSFPQEADLIHRTGISLMSRFSDVFYIGRGGLEMREHTRPLVRIIASHVDTFASETTAHSAAI